MLKLLTNHFTLGLLCHIVKYYSIMYFEGEWVGHIAILLCI